MKRPYLWKLAWGWARFAWAGESLVIGALFCLVIGGLCAVLVLGWWAVTMGLRVVVPVLAPFDLVVFPGLCVLGLALVSRFRGWGAVHRWLERVDRLCPTMLFVPPGARAYGRTGEGERWELREPGVYLPRPGVQVIFAGTPEQEEEFERAYPDGG